MTEVDVAVTDYLLCVETAYFSYALYRQGKQSDLARYFRTTFISLSIASLLGGTSHGFFNDPVSAVHSVLWWATLFAIGVTAAGFALAGHVLLTGVPLPRSGVLVVPLLLGYAVVTFINPVFFIAIVFYLPAILMCLAGFVAQHRRHPGQGALWGVAGIALSLAASVGQQLGISLHPVYLTHNAVYHVLMMVALLLVYVGVHKITAASARHGVCNTTS